MRCQARGRRTGSGLGFEVVWRRRMNTFCTVMLVEYRCSLLTSTTVNKKQVHEPHPMQRYKASSRKATWSECT